MAIADGGGLPLAVSIASARPGEVTIGEQTFDARFLADTPTRLIGDKAYHSDRFDARHAAERGIKLITPNGRARGPTQDGRQLRRYCSHWKIERLFAWLQNLRRSVTRYERHADNFLAFVQLRCIVLRGCHMAR